MTFHVCSASRLQNRVTKMTKYKMEISLNVLNHLGIKLYSSTPAVLSEVIANSWDAGANNVHINISEEEMIITDDGCGMTANDINEKFLLVGYQKRLIRENPSAQRPVMGRKGIGKLSLFSIADNIKIHSFKDGEKSGLILKSKEINELINDKNRSYFPESINDEEISLQSNGTKIILTELKKNINKTSEFLKKRISRRFSVIGDRYDFNVFINNQKVSIEDRMYFDKLQSIWAIGQDSETYFDFCQDDQVKLKKTYHSVVSDTKNFACSGWIGTVSNSGLLKDENLNKVSVIVRGKVALEDILPEYPETGLFSKYLIGEIRADFLDDDDKDDIATSSRQDFQKEDERFQELKNWIGKLLKSIQKDWDLLREDQGVSEATQIPAVQEWLNLLKGDTKSKAKKVLGKINQIISDDPAQKKMLFQQSIIAFEYFRHKEQLDKLTTVGPENIESVVKVFENLDDLEASLYYKIVDQRLEVIKKLEEKIINNSLEKTIQHFLFDHLWLLDPSWERAAGSEEIERSFQKALESSKLTSEEKKSRMDIKYRTTSGMHVIVELKKPDVTLSVYDLIKQVDKYKSALSKTLATDGEIENIKIICVLGKRPKEFEKSSSIKGAKESLRSNSIDVYLYDELLTNARKSYSAYLIEKDHVGKIQKTLNQISASVFE